MSKEISAGDIETYLSSRRSEQGQSHARNILERCWMENRDAILATYGGARGAIAELFDRYGMDHLSRKIWNEWDLRNDPEALVDQVLELETFEHQAERINELLTAGKLGRGQDEPRYLLNIADRTGFPEVRRYLAKIMKRRRSMPGYEAYGNEIDALLADRLAQRQERRETEGYENFDLRPYGDYDYPIDEEEDGEWPIFNDHDRSRGEGYQEFSPLATARYQREQEEARHELRERKRRKRAAKQGRLYTPRPFVPSVSLKLLEGADPEDLEDIENAIYEDEDGDYWSDHEGEQSEFHDLDDFPKVLPSESNHEYHARQWKYYIQGRPYQGGDRQRASKFKARRRREDEMRRQEKTYE